MTNLQQMYVDELDQFCIAEYGSPADTKDLEHIGVLYSTFEDYNGRERELLVEVDITNQWEPKMSVFADGSLAYKETMPPEEILEETQGWSFDSLYSWAESFAKRHIGWKED